MKQFKINEENRNALVQYLENSVLPYKDVKNILIMLVGLEEIKEPEVKKEDK